MNWNKTVFLHTGWTRRYHGDETPEGGHAYLKQSVGVEAENFKPMNGWCYGYAPVSRTSEGRQLDNIPKANRTLKIDKLGASPDDGDINGITVIWTARNPSRGPVIVGIYENATVFRFMPGLTSDKRPFIAKARVQDCHLLPAHNRDFDVIQKKKGFPGMAATWFPGLHAEGPAMKMLASASDYFVDVRRYDYAGNLSGV